MENIKDSKRLKYIYNDKSYIRDKISNINHTNINNNINITNYYPSPSQNYCNKQTFTFIDENGSVQNAISYPIKTASHKSKKIKDSSPTTTPSAYGKKYHQFQSPYMKKILPSSKRQKSEEGNRIISIYKSSPSTKYLKSCRKKSLKNNFYNENILKKNETQQYINISNNRKINKDKKYYYYLDSSIDEINNKYKSNRIYNNKNNTNNTYNSNNRSELKKSKDINYKSPLNNRPFLINNKSMISYESNITGHNADESLLNIFETPYQISMTNNHPLPLSFQPLYKISSYEKNNIISYNTNFHSPKMANNIKNLKIDNKRKFYTEKQLIKNIILIQSALRGYLLRVKLAQYLDLYERIKKAVSFIQYIFLQKMRYAFYALIKNNLNKKLIKYYKISNRINNNFKCLLPVNNLSFEIKKRNGSTISNESLNIKNKMMLNDIQKELNKKNIDFANAEKRIKELLIENKKIQNINKIIVRDNKQLALKLKNLQNFPRPTLKMQNNDFNILNNNKRELRIKLYSILRNIILNKEFKEKIILNKYFYKFNYRTKLIQFNNIININKKSLIIENNNFLVIKNKNEQNCEKIIDKEKINRILKNIILKKEIRSYFYRNTFEKWILKAIIIKNKEFAKEKKKKKKEKFKQRKLKKLYGNVMDKNNKKNEDENENSGDFDDFDFERKYSNKSESSKKNNEFYDNDK